MQVLFHKTNIFVDQNKNGITFNFKTSTLKIAHRAKNIRILNVGSMLVKYIDVKRHLNDSSSIYVHLN